MGIILILGVLIFLIAAIWKIFEKAGQPGWASIVPFYNYYIMTKIGEKPEWWTVLLIIPYVNIIFGIWIWNRIAKRFGKSEAFTVGIFLLPFIFIPILGFGDAKYKGENNSLDDSDVLDEDLLIEEN